MPYIVVDFYYYNGIDNNGHDDNGAAVKTFTLYSTLGCHLCEHALSMIQPVAGQHRCTVREIDISDSEELVQQYGVIIPVLQRDHDQQQLRWPFTVEEVIALMGEER